MNRKKKEKNEEKKGNKKKKAVEREKFLSVCLGLRATQKLF
jgi:hypothetical protein